VKPATKAIVLSISGLLVLLALAWTGTFFYWHIQIKAAIGELDIERDAHRQLAPQSTFLRAGCRSLPYSVNALSSTRKPEAQRGWGILIYFYAMNENDPAGNARLADLCLMKPKDSPQERQRKTDAILAWWQNSGGDYHQWWRVWSSKCR
jgi:hypothetical protein